MANQKKQKRTTSKHPSRKSELSMVQYEILVILMLVAALFVMMSIYFDGGGFIGRGVEQIFFGLFGMGAWLLPIFIFVASFMKAFNKGNERLNTKLLLVFIGIVFFSVLCHVLPLTKAQFGMKINEKRVYFEPLALYYIVSAQHHVRGGFVGGLIGDILFFFTGKYGSRVILLAIYTSLFIAISERSFFELVQAGYKRIIHFTTKSLHQLEEKAEARSEQKNKVSTEKQAVTKKPVNDKRSPKKRIASLFQSTLAMTSDAPIEADSQHGRQEMTVGSKTENEPKSESIHESEVLGTVQGVSDDMAAVKTENEPDMKQEHIDEAKPDKVGKKSKVKEKPVDTEIIKQEILTEVVKNDEIYQAPPMELLKDNPFKSSDSSTEHLDANATKLEETLASFGVGAKVIDVSVGPTVTRYELQPAQGVKVSKIVNLSDDIALNLAASGIRIEAPIPGKSAVGIEVPNKETTSVFLKEVIDSKTFESFPSRLAFALGKDIGGKEMIADIAKMPHLLIAGATGSGKSVCVNTLITSIIYKSSPEDVKLLMIDPKVVELSVYNGIPHLLIPVVTDPKKAAGALNWAVAEMLERYNQFAEANVRDIKGYNEYVRDNDDLKKMPQIVIIVDELADLMVAAAGDVEEAICRLAQMARAAGIHLIIATQRPSVDVITGLIKANIPSRIAFNVSSGVDSRTIIDMNGAEKLMGKGDMLFYPVGLQKPVRVQGAFISDKEVEHIVSYLKKRKKEDYDKKIIKQLEQSVSEERHEDQDYDPIFEQALELCVDKQKASASMIQRRFRVGYNRAARILDQLHEAGYVGDEEGSKPRKMLMSKEEFLALKARATGDDQEVQEQETPPEVQTPVSTDTQSTEEEVIHD